jgi:murein DD-endopeptidase MepM/ murein hydrolase activator NlpD
MMLFRPLQLILVALVSTAFQLFAQPFQLPTANHALFQQDKEGEFFVGTVGKPWTSGTFGCVRTDGHQLHEGLDIRSIKRDRHGESTDPVMASADGAVVYISKKAGLSNYGIYVVLRHKIEGLEIYTLYAHLREVTSSLRIGQQVKQGEVIGIMGRSTNTREGISKERAHVHFEINFLVNENFPAWYKSNFPDQRNDHKQWNGQNLIAIDPQVIFQEQRRLGRQYSLVRQLKQQAALCHVQVRARDFSWLKRHPQFIRPNPRATAEGIAGYELILNFNGLPLDIIPRAGSEMKGQRKYELLSVNAKEVENNPCRKLVRQRGSGWELTAQGMNALSLLTF